MSLADTKRTVRLLAQEKRKAAADSAPSDSADRLSAHLIDLISTFTGVQTVSGFLPIADEIDILPSLRHLHSKNYKTCLPVVVAKNQPLVFRLWIEGDAIAPGPLKTRHPLPSAIEVIPDVLLVPLLAFDLSGCRIGWGGGFYDRTLAGYYSQSREVTAIGVAYEGQCRDDIPHGEFDVPMDYIATEKQIFKTMKAGS